MDDSCSEPKLTLACRVKPASAGAGVGGDVGGGQAEQFALGCVCPESIERLIQEARSEFSVGSRCREEPIA